MKNKDNWVGIDFGTCYTCTARLVDNIPVMIPVRDAPGVGIVQRPTVAYITESGSIKTGFGAEFYRFTDPSRFFSEFKLDILDTMPLLSDLPYTYADLVIAILKDIYKDICKDNNGIPIENAIITVPSVYTKGGPRWELMIKVAKEARFKEVELFYEPEAAALYYEYVSGEALDELSLIYDLGGGTFDPALIKKTQNGGELLKGYQTEGLVVGGVRFDGLIYSKLTEKIPQLDDIKRSGDYKKIGHLLSFCKELKHLLSGTNVATAPSPFDKNLEVSLTRQSFENMINPLLDQTMTCCTQLLRSCGIKWNDLSRVILVGGSSNIPFIKEKITDFLDALDVTNVQVNHTINNQKRIDPIYAIALGAMIVKLKKGSSNFMNVKLYEEKRNELINLLDDVLYINEINNDIKEEIQKTQKKLMENNFEIVLVGEFQSGKSTTFNAICDGREISPRGAMTKTSACKISASNLSNPNMKEYVEVTWKTDRELLLAIIGIVEPYLREECKERFGKATREQMIQHIDVEEMNLKDVEPLDLHNPSDLKLLKNAMTKEWEYYNKNRSKYEEEKLDVLYIATLIAHFVNSNEIQNLRNKLQVSINDMSKLVTFPMDWASRWQGNSAMAFKPEEISFAFLAEVHCYIHSPNLARLGCVITDCPGLFASPWDTEVAQKAMLEANAILYLFGGQKTLRQGDLKALNEIRKMKMEHKLFYAINVKGKIRTVKNNILPENVAKLRAQGYEVSEENIYLYHALLGLCYKNGMLLINGTMDYESKRRFIEVAKKIEPDYEDNFEDIWVEICDDMLHNIVRNESVGALDIDNVNKVRRYSGLKKLFNGIEETVIEKKAYAVLVSQGANRANAAMSQLESELKYKEMAALEDEEKFREALLEARLTLEEFQTKAVEIVNGLKEESIGIQLAEDFEHEVVFTNVDAIANVATQKIIEDLITLKFVGKSMWVSITSKFSNKQNKFLEEKMNPIFENAMKDICDPAALGWIEKIKQGENETYNLGINTKSEEINRKISELWKEEVSTDNNSYDLLDGLEIEMPIGTIVENEKLFEKFETNNLEGDVNGASGIVMIGGLLGLTVGTVTAAATFALSCYLLISIGLGFVPIIIPAVAAFIAAAIAGGATKEKSKEFAGKKLRKTIAIEMNNTINNIKTKTQLRKVSLEVVDGFNQLYLNYYHNSLHKQRKKFKERAAEREKLYVQKEEFRRELAKEANNLRTEKVAPMRVKIEIYRKNILSILGMERVE